MLTIGLTGSIGVGKSAVTAIFAELGAVCFDADSIAREVVEPGSDGLRRVVDEFGTGVLDSTGRLDRKALAAIVFSNPERRLRLEAILHPLIHAEQDRRIEDVTTRDPNAVVVVDAALMIESGGHRRFDALVVVHCDPQVQLGRLMQRDDLSREEALARVAAQMTQEEKLRYADYTVDTSGTLDETRARTLEIWEQLQARRSIKGQRT